MNAEQQEPLEPSDIIGARERAAWLINQQNERDEEYHWTLHPELLTAQLADMQYDGVFPVGRPAPILQTVIASAGGMNNEKLLSIPHRTFWRGNPTIKDVQVHDIIELGLDSDHYRKLAQSKPSPESRDAVHSYRRANNRTINDIVGREALSED